MENINTNISSLQDQKPELTKSKQIIALVAGISLIVQILESGISYLVSLFSVLHDTQMYGYGPAPLLNQLPGLLAQITSAAPLIPLFVYLIFFFKKNPVHGTVKVSVILSILSALFSILSTVASLIAYLVQDITEVYIIIPNILSILYYFISVVVAIGLCVAVFTRFKHPIVPKIFQGLLALSYIIILIVRVIIFYNNFYFSEGYIFELISLIAVTVFWFVCIDSSTYSRAPAKKKKAPKPVTQPTQPVYQAPVQPVTQPVYQTPVQPVAQPVYQTPVQPVTQPPLSNVAQPREDDVQTKLLKLKKLFDDGLITQEEYDAKRAEIIGRI